MRSIFKKAFFLLLICLISFILFVTNYKPGTYLIGWDNLFPEFNFRLNISRELNAVWQQYRGMGTIDGMAHASLIFQDIERWLMSFVMPTDLIRWVYILAMHLIGGLGMYFLLRYLIKNKPIAFIGALFYQYNIGTIQQFFLPLELFTVHFAFLPWLIFLALRYLEDNNRKNLLYFFIVSALSAPQAHVPTIFIVYAIAMGLVFLTVLFTSKFAKTKSVIILSLIIFATNAYWGLPFTYSTLTHSQIISNSKSFEMDTNDIYYRNNVYGDFSDVALIKGVTMGFNYLDYKTGSYRLMMQTWLDYMQKPAFYLPAWAFFILALIGLLAILKKRNKTLLPFAVLFAFAFFMMGTDTPVIGIVSNFLRDHITLFRVVFRFTFTKFSILYVFSYSVLLAIGAQYLIRMLHKRTTYVISFILFLLIIIYSLPSFAGHFFYENLAVNIPKDYFQLFDFFNKQDPNTRVANLPIPWYWAWLQPNWGTINSGFAWYAIPQPLTDLAFTYWNDTNENFYWELDQAIYGKNTEMLNKTLKKYDISWVYLDKNIYNNPGQKMTYEDYESLLAKTDGLKLVKTFGAIDVYRFTQTEKFNNFTGVKNNLPKIGPEYNYDNFDFAYAKYGDYFTSRTNNDYFYPFRSLFSNKDPKDQQYSIREDSNNLIFSSKLPQTGMIIQSSQPFPEEMQIFNNDFQSTKYAPQTLINDRLFTVKLDKSAILKYRNINDSPYLNQTNNACSKTPNGLALLKKDGNKFTLTSVGTHNCVKVSLPELSHEFGYLLTVNVVNDNKRGLEINVFNETVKKSDLDIYTDNDGQKHHYYLVIPPSDHYGVGYTLYFDNISEGREKVINTLGDINVYQIPYYYLKDVHFINTNSAVNRQNNTIYYLSQSYSPDWKAYQNGKELQHVLVNNWANGWILNGNNTNNITVIYWPQYLEYAGFGLWFISVIIVLYGQSLLSSDKKS